MIVRSKRTSKLKISLVGNMSNITASVSTCKAATWEGFAKRVVRSPFRGISLVLSPRERIYDKTSVHIAQRPNGRRGLRAGAIFEMQQQESCSFLEATPRVDASWKPNTMCFHACLARLLRNARFQILNNPAALGIRLGTPYNCDIPYVPWLDIFCFLA